MPCTEKNPLTREGTSLLNRVLAALSTDYAKVDERDAANIILFAKRYAAYLNYYDENNLLQGGWQDLMRMDVSVTLATLVHIDMQQVAAYKKRLFKRIKLAANDADAKTAFKFLFDLLFSLVKLVDEQFKLLPDSFEYKAIFSDVIKNKLQLPLSNLEQYFNDYKTTSLLDYSTSELDSDAVIEVQFDGNFNRSTLSAEWQTAVADSSITVPALPTAKEKIVYIINHNLFTAQIDGLFNGVSSVVNRANELLIQTLNDFPQHSPHYALFIAFIKLFAHEQEALNAYTKKHLDFYYKEVLQLVNKAPEPDSAHLLFELQKPVSEHRLLKGTLFKGGKDVVTGKEINYALTDDVVFNKAVVSKLYSTQIVHRSKNILKAAPVTNSDDGKGGKLTTADKSWFTFGDPKKVENAKTGFAIISNILFLNEGARIVTVTAQFLNPVPELSLYNLNCFTAQYTGGKKWIDPSSPLAVSTDVSKGQLIFTIALTPDDPAVVPYSEAVHAEGLETSLPVLKIYLDQDISNAIPYTLLCNKVLTRLSVAVDVSGVKDLMLSHDNGTIDASKPFKPFGDFPGIGAGFYIGSREIFQKQLARLEINTSWKTPVNGPLLNTTAYYLRQGTWNSLNMSNSSLVDTIAFSGANIFTPTAINFDKTEKLTANTVEGFLRIVLNDDQYSLANHLINISNALSNGTTISSDGKDAPTFTIKIAATPVPKEVVLNTLSVNYRAVVDLPLSTLSASENNLFLHLSPFGFSQVNNALVDVSDNAELTTPISLVQHIRNEGELYIGLENAIESQVLNILFQVAEGSSNPLRDVEELKWYYLAANNNWKLFKEENVIDRTENFNTSGIVTLTLPMDISNNNTLLDNGLHWIKVAAHPYADAVCKMILIQAQTAKVELVQDETNGIEFRQLLPANTISKLVVSDGAIKKIEQPFDSFGGRLRETDDHFYIRVSERLRHKQRAITIWDYEHIILEKFQKIFKVKCLNHSGFYTQNDEEIFCENYPGHVSIITIPDLNSNTNINPLRPYTPVGLLKQIEKYLKTITSPFVNLHVKNPQFEEIQLDFNVKFYDNLSESFYLQLLNTEIEQFLCPWAFNNTMEITFSGKIYKSVLLNFVEERPYVDFVTCFKMNHIITRDEHGINAILNVEEATASTARSVLVSYYDEDTNTRHIIHPTATCTCS